MTGRAGARSRRAVGSPCTPPETLLRRLDRDTRWLVAAWCQFGVALLLVAWAVHRIGLSVQQFDDLAEPPPDGLLPALLTGVAVCVLSGTVCLVWPRLRPSR